MESISNFVTALGFKNKVDEESGSIVLSLDPYTKIDLQEKYDLEEANKNLIDWI